MNPAICGAAGALAIYAARKREAEEAKKKKPVNKTRLKTYTGKIIIPEFGSGSIASFEVEACTPEEARRNAAELFLEKVNFLVDGVDNKSSEEEDE